MTQLFRDVWLERTNQAWKLILFFLFLLMSLGIFVIFVWKINNPNLLKDIDEITLSFSFVGIGGIAFVWLWLSIRCPSCKKSVTGFLLRKEDSNKFLTTLVTLQQCPICQDSGKRKGVWL